MKFLVLGLASLCGALRHPPPTVHLEIDILPNAVHVDVVGELHVWNAWLGTSVSTEYLLSRADCARLQAKATEFFGRANRFQLDGKPVVLNVTEVIPPTDFDPGRGMPNVRIRLRAPSETEAKTLGMVWETFELTDWFEKPAVPVTIRYRGDVEQAVLTPREPEYVWHTRVVTPRRVRLDRVSADNPTDRSLPVLSAALLCGGLGWLLFARKRHPVRAGLGAAGLLLAALALRDTALVRLPWGGVRMPGETQAIDIFQRLQGNVYRAFEASTAEDVYDLLSVSVVPEILDELYADVYESLVLRGQGGAVCKVEKLDLFERALVAAPAPARGLGFDVACGWRVHGLVSHWGHEHRRLNQYRATYSVVHDGQAWKIGRVVVSEQQRVGDNG
jgi:hypothetical protein